jgi:hypothetical protein
MRTFSDSTSPMRVLMRIPDLSPEAAPAPQREVFEQKPLAPLASAFPKDAPKAKPARANVTPEELQTTGKFARALKILAGLAVAGVVAAALTNRSRPSVPSPSLPEETTVEHAPTDVPGGSLKQITQAPEIKFPEESAPPSKDEQFTIQRLPAIEGATSETTMAAASDRGAAGQVLAQKPGVVQLNGTIEHSRQ